MNGIIFVKDFFLTTACVDYHQDNAWGVDVYETVRAVGFTEKHAARRLKKKLDKAFAVVAAHPFLADTNMSPKELADRVAEGRKTYKTDVEPKERTVKDPLPPYRPQTVNFTQINNPGSAIDIDPTGFPYRKNNPYPHGSPNWYRWNARQLTDTSERAKLYLYYSEKFPSFGIGVVEAIDFNGYVIRVMKLGQSVMRIEISKEAAKDLLASTDVLVVENNIPEKMTKQEFDATYEPVDKATFTQKGTGAKVQIDRGEVRRKIADKLGAHFKKEHPGKFVYIHDTDVGFRVEVEARPIRFFTSSEAWAFIQWLDKQEDAFKNGEKLIITRAECPYEAAIESVNRFYGIQD